MIRLNDILQRVASYHPDPDLDIIKKAYVYSAKVHQGQLRKSGEPYLIHPLEVAAILAGRWCPLNLVACHRHTGWGDIQRILKSIIVGIRCRHCIRPRIPVRDGSRFG